MPLSNLVKQRGRHGERYLIRAGFPSGGNNVRGAHRGVDRFSFSAIGGALKTSREREP